MRAVVQVDKRTREVIGRFGSALEAEKSLGYVNGGVSRACRNRSVWMGDWYLRYERDYDPDEDISGKVGCPVYTVDFLTGERAWYPTRNACAEALFVHTSTVYYSIKHDCYIANRYKVYKAGRRFE